MPRLSLAWKKNCAEWICWLCLQRVLVSELYGMLCRYYLQILHSQKLCPLLYGKSHIKLNRKGASNRNSDRRIYLVVFDHCKTNPLCKSFFQYFCSDWDCLEKRLSLGQCLVKNPCFNMECYPAKLQHQKCSTDITGKILLIYIFYNLKTWLCQHRHVCQKPQLD